MLTHPQDNGTRAIAAVTAPTFHSLVDLNDAIRALEHAEFEITTSTTPTEHVATLERNRFRIRVTLNLLIPAQHVGVSQLGDDGEPDCLVLRKGKFRRGKWVPFTMDDAVHEALWRVRQISGSKTPDTMTVRVRNHAVEAPWGSGLVNPAVVTVTISAACPTCGGQRGEPRNSNQCDDGAYYSVDVWDNPCGHVDYYKAVLAEAAARTGAQR